MPTDCQGEAEEKYPEEYRDYYRELKCRLTLLIFFPAENCEDHAAFEFIPNLNHHRILYGFTMKFQLPAA